MRSTNYTGLAGALLMIAGGFSPMLRVPIIGNWNYWDLHIVLAVIAYILAGLGILASLSGKNGLLRFSGWAALFIVLLTLAGAFFKIHDSFSFIPFRKLAAYAENLVKFKWIGWVLLFAGAGLMIFGAGRRQGS